MYSMFTMLCVLVLPYYMCIHVLYIVGMVWFVCAQLCVCVCVCYGILFVVFELFFLEKVVPTIGGEN